MAWSPLECTRLWPSLGMPSQRQNWELLECCTMDPSVHCKHAPTPDSSAVMKGSSGGALWDPSQNLCLQAGLAFNVTCLTQGPWLNNTCYNFLSFLQYGQHILSCPFASATGTLCSLDPFEEREKSSLFFFHEPQRKIYFRVNICMHIGCELFSKQAGHNGFQF